MTARSPDLRGRRRRANGEGSIWLRKDGRYGYAAFVPTTAGTFKRVQGYARTREDARRKLTELVRRADEGLPVASVNWTVAQYLTYWLRDVVRADRRPKTYQGYESVVHLHRNAARGRMASAAGRGCRLVWFSRSTLCSGTRLNRPCARRSSRATWLGWSGYRPRATRSTVA